MKCKYCDKEANVVADYWDSKGEVHEQRVCVEHIQLASMQNDLLNRMDNLRQRAIWFSTPHP